MTVQNLKARHAAVEPELRGAGLKATLPRIRILQAFQRSAAGHLSADEVHASLAVDGLDVSLATVYRCLAQLERVGLLLRNVFDGGKAVFEVNKGGRHDHLVCLRCGRVDEFTDDRFDILQRDIARKNGYAIAQHRISLFGHCATCSANPGCHGASKRN